MRILSNRYSYDQRAVLTGLIARHARAPGVASLLDIGAGEGGVAGAIAAMVPRYLAVECDAGRAAALRARGLEVVEATFPCAVPGGPFDLVVSSHSIPEGPPADYPAFVDAAWALLAPRGTLLIATFKGPDIDPIQQLVGDYLGAAPVDDPRYAELLRLLSARGTVATATVSSHVRTDSLADVAIRFESWFRRAGTLADDGMLVPAMAALVDRRFLRNGTYTIATPHSVVTATRT